jgi:histidinol-phosphate aminotransferase
MKKIDLTALAKKSVRSLQAYQAKEIPCAVKLDANESPYSLGAFENLLVKNALKQLNRYPDPEARALREAIAKACGVTPENILLGNGSDEIIYYLIITFGGPVIYPVPTFSMYGIISQALGEKHRGIPLDPRFDIDLAAMDGVVKKLSPKLLFLSSPNNPTGNCYSTDRIRALIKSSPGIVVVDEAYQPFSEEGTFLGSHRKYRNLVVLRTFSKIGFASLRVGFMVADAALVQEVNKVRLPYNLNALSQAIALQAMKSRGAVEKAIGSVVSERKRLMEELGSLEGVTPCRSDANFILFRVAQATDVYEGLLQRGVLVRNMDGVVRGALRVTVGTPRENSLFLRALRGVLRKVRR